MPSSADAEENSTKADRSMSRVSSCRLSAASTFGRSTTSMRCGVSAVTTPSSSTPAACTTAVRSGIVAISDRSASRSAASQATTLTSAPNSVRSAAPAPAPLRLANTRLRTPCSVTRCLATKPPRVPVPPVISTVPFGFSRTPLPAPARASRGTCARRSRTATSGSPTASTAGNTSGR